MQCQLEVDLAPRIKDFLGAGVSSGLPAARPGMALRGPIFASVIDGVSALVGICGGIACFIYGIPLNQADILCMERLGAIDRAAAILRDAAGSAGQNPG